MKQVRTSLNNQQHQTFCGYLKEIDETEYRFVKNSVEIRQAILSSLKKGKYPIFLELCEKLHESPSEFIRKAVEERMQKNGGLLMKAQKWLWEDHPLIKKQ